MRSPSELRAHCAVFDLDGTLVDTRDAVVSAYKAVGVTMPDDAWGKPWYAWLPTVTGSNSHAMSLHRAKNVMYLERMVKNPPKVNHELVDRLVELDALGYDIRVLTGMSAEPANFILHEVLHIGDFVVNPMLGCDFEMKVSSLAFFFDMYGPHNVTYFDDDHAVVEQLATILPTSVTLVSVNSWT